MPKRSVLSLPKDHPSIMLWGLAAVFTFLLPDAILLYRYIEAHFGSLFAGKVPFFLVIIFGSAYVIYLLASKISLKNLIYLIPSAVIVWIIFTFVSNPNKHIHIPEYVLMAWLIYAALSRDYHGKGIFILIFICTSMLGVVDELEQGIHPGRFYGSSDMLVNSASALIGVFTIMGLRRISSTDWAWTSDWKKFKGFLGLILFGAVGAVIMCSYLFQVQAHEGIFPGIYPAWLLVWNGLYLVATPLMIYRYHYTTYKQGQGIDNQDAPAADQKMSTAKLWIFPPLAILFYMHLLVVYVSIAGINFR